MIVSAFGLCGGILAAVVSTRLHWQTSYIAGGVMGLLLLIFRISLHESILYDQLKQQAVKRGSLIQLLRSKSQTIRFILCVLSGAPAFVFMSIYVTLSPEFCKAFNVPGTVSVGHAIMVYLILFTVSDVACGLLSKLLQKRKTPLLIYAGMQAITMSFFLLVPPNSTTGFYVRCAFLGFSVGYWGLLITNTLEQFGTNIRATVATSVSNLIRGITIPASLIFLALSKRHGIVTSGIIIGFSLITLSIISLFFLKDRFENDLNFIE